MNRKSIIFILAFALFLVLFSFNVVTAQDSAPTPFLGISFEPTDNSIQVTHVVPESPAATAGLQVGDVITAINDEPIKADSLADTLHDFAVDEEITLSVLRDEKPLDIEVTLDKAPEAEPNVSPLPMDSFVYMQNGEEHTWQIRNLTENNPLYEAGLRAGDTITHFNGESYDPTGLRQFLADLDEDATVKVTVEREGETLAIEVPATALEVLVRFSLGFSFSGDDGALIPFNQFFDFEPFGFFGNEDWLFNRLQEMLKQYTGPGRFWLNPPRLNPAV